jgi:hypothetical protein
MSTLPFFEDLIALFRIAFLFLVSLTAKKISSADTPTTVSCKAKLVIALHNTLSIVLLDIWEQNILVFGEEWV